MSLGIFGKEKECIISGQRVCQYIVNTAKLMCNANSENLNFAEMKTKQRTRCMTSLSLLHPEQMMATTAALSHWAIMAFLLHFLPLKHATIIIPTCIWRWSVLGPPSPAGETYHLHSRLCTPTCRAHSTWQAHPDLLSSYRSASTLHSTSKQTHTITWCQI